VSGELKVLVLKVLDYKRIHRAEIYPEEVGIVRIMGDNGEGKSSLLDALETSFSGEDKRGTPEPVRRGAKKSLIYAELGRDGEIEWTLTVEYDSHQSRELVLRDGAGKKAKTPATLLKSFYSSVCFDLSEFLQADNQTVMALLQRAMGIDFEKEDADRRLLTEERQEAKREVGRLQGVVDSFELGIDSYPEVERSSPELSARLEAAIAHNSSIERAFEAVTQAERAHDSAAEAVARFEEGVRRALDAYDAAQRQKAAAVSAQSDALMEIQRKKGLVAAIGEKLEVADIRMEIHTIDGHNEKVRRKREKSREVRDLKAAIEQADQLSAAMKKIDEVKRKKLSETKFSISGITFDPDLGTLVDGFPFAQASQSTRREIAMAVGFAGNPKVRVGIIRDASLFDEDAQVHWEELALAWNAQIFLEIVGDRQREIEEEVRDFLGAGATPESADMLRTVRLKGVPKGYLIRDGMVVSEDQPL